MEGGDEEQHLNLQERHIIKKVDSMGKECEGTPTYRRRALLKARVGVGERGGETFAPWCQEKMAKLSEICDNGYAIVTLRKASCETTIVCRGLANEGNASSALIKRLRDSQLLSHSAKVLHMYLCHELVWESLSPEKTYFRSGDSLVLIIREPRLLKRPARGSARSGVIRKLRFD